MTALEKAKDWRYVKGDWLKGWKLTRRGVNFAKEVERKLNKRSGK